MEEQKITNTGTGPIENIPIPDPSERTTEALRSGVDSAVKLLESQLNNLRAELDAFRTGHEDKHHSVVNAAIQHRKELSDASVAIVKAQIDAQFTSVQSQISSINKEIESRFNALMENVKEAARAADKQYQQRYDAQTDASQTAFDAAQEATAAALASAKEAVATALAAAKEAIVKSEASTDKLIPRAEVESRFGDFDKQVKEINLVNERRVATIENDLAGLSGLSEKIEKAIEGLTWLDRVTDAKFVTFKTLIESNADRVALALAASNKAVDAAFASSAAAIGKAEIFNEKRFDIITKDIDELKVYAAATSGKGEGASALWGFLAGGIGLLIAVTSIILAFNN